MKNFLPFFEDISIINVEMKKSMQLFFYFILFKDSCFENLAVNNLIKYYLLHTLIAIPSFFFRYSCGS
jgi:hypothetical protein